MKKSIIFFLLVLVFAEFANAQIVLEHTFNREVYPSTYTLSSDYEHQFVYGDLFWSFQDVNGENKIVLYDANNYEVVTSFHRCPLLFLNVQRGDGTIDTK